MVPLLNLSLFIRICLPLCSMFLIVRGSARKNLLFLIFGLCTCLFCGEVSGLLYNLNSFSDEYFYTNVTPVIEETAKTLPVLFYLFFYKPDRKAFLETAMAIGIGFAILENIYALAGGFDDASITAALIRGFLSGMLHAFSTLLVAFGISFIDRNRKVFWAGIITFFTLAVTLHSIYNCICCTKYWFLSSLVILLMFASVFIGLKRKKFL